MATMQQSDAAEITILPANLGDVRCSSPRSPASAAVRTDQEDVLRGSSAGPADRAAAVRILREDMRLLD